MSVLPPLLCGQILKDEKNYGRHLASIEGLPGKVYNKQLISTERLFKGLLQTT